MIVYLDNASTTRVCEEAARAALEVMTQDVGIPSARDGLAHMDAPHV